jgi:hypothetical protein
MVALGTVAPWTVRNYVRFETFIPVSTNSGYNLLLGNSENARPNSGVNVDLTRYTLPAERMNEVERDDYFKRNAVRWVVEQPLSALRLYARKVLNYFNFRNQLATSSESSSSRDLVMFITYYPLLALSIVRLFFRKRYTLSKREVLLYIFYFGNAFLSAVFFTRLRFRIPFDFVLIAIASIFLGNLARSCFDSTAKNEQTDAV